MAAFTPIAPGSLGDRLDGALVAVQGPLTAVMPKVTGQGMPWASAFIDGLECLVFPAVYRKSAALLTVGATVTVSGRVDLRESQPRLVAMEIGAT